MLCQNRWVLKAQSTKVWRDVYQPIRDIQNYGVFILDFEVSDSVTKGIIDLCCIDLENGHCFCYDNPDGSHRYVLPAVIDWIDRQSYRVHGISMEKITQSQPIEEREALIGLINFIQKQSNVNIILSHGVFDYHTLMQRMKNFSLKMNTIEMLKQRMKGSVKDMKLGTIYHHCFGKPELLTVSNKPVSFVIVSPEQLPVRC